MALRAAAEGGLAARRGLPQAHPAVPLGHQSQLRLHVLQQRCVRLPLGGTRRRRRPCHDAAILATQKNAAIVQSEDTDGGHYVRAEVDGLLGRDTVEFLVRPGRVTYRAIAGRVVYVYPFTTPLGDFGAQRRHLRQLEDELGWGHPEYTSKDAGSY
eukprot:SM000171S03248  [mRNA]  locus=s171:217316:218172:- [translate_table: standard]